MDCKYPHWYMDDDNLGECCDYPQHDMVCDDYKMAYPMESFKDRLLCLLGDEVLFSVDARFCGKETFCGTLCYIGCDFIIVNVCVRRQSLSMHIPIRMLRFISPYK